ncbi:hypothetical protein NA78x_005772 [Anatilimnocola sp. NA78]|uniref:hypothetical protein n=1 Tax=Anatilimnocola sp. NA78 TaxID=3415683 RepID=UPI003CE5AB68
MSALLSLDQQSQRMPLRWPDVGAWLLVAGWVVVVTAGSAGLQTYKARAGASPDKIARVPGELLTEQNARGCTLVMFAHPQCACTRASLNELAVLLARNPNLAPAKVVFSAPTGSDASWRESDLVMQAEGLSGVQVQWDTNQRLADELGIRTSGQVVLFDRKGEVLFTGGVTTLRGHEGWSNGHNAILAASRGEVASASSTPVFGCSLHAVSTAAQEAAR